MASSRIDGDLLVTGTIGAGTITPTAGSVTDSAVAAGAAIDEDKLKHLYKAGTNFGIEADAAPATTTTYTFQVWVASGTATLRSFKAMILDTGSQANSNDFTFDLQKATAGTETLTTMLSAVITLDSDTTDATMTAATLASTALVAGDILVMELVTPATITGAHGVYAQMEIDEGAN